MIEVRRITPEELLMTNKIETVVFNGRNDFSKEETKSDLLGPPEWKWGAFENGKLTSSMAEIPYLMRFDGHSVKMSGIGGVGTLPEARKGGKIRDIFNILLPEAYENGTIFSNLTPFSHEFYKRFGYELSHCRNEISIPTKQFENRKLTGDFQPFFPGDDTSVLEKIHSQYISNLNHGISRSYWPEDRAWRGFTSQDPYKTGTFLYVWYNDAGEAKSYLKYQHNRVKDSNQMLIKELAFLDKEALYGALSIVSGLSSQYDTLVWGMPTFLEPTDFIGDMWKVSQRIIPRDMTRVVNVAEALKRMRRPEGEGSYTIEVVDPQIAANQARYLVEYGLSGTMVSTTTKDPDLLCDIPALSPLVMGFRTIDSMRLTRRDGMRIEGNLQTLQKVFTQRPQHLTEEF